MIKTTAITIDVYIATFPEPIQEILKDLRSAIKKQHRKPERKLIITCPPLHFMAICYHSACFTFFISKFTCNINSTYIRIKCLVKSVN